MALRMVSSLRMQGECQLLGLACSQQTLVEGPNHWVEASGDQGSHVKDRPYRGASAPEGAFPPPGATIPVEGCYPHQGAELPAVQGPQFGQLRHEGGSEGGAHPRHTAAASPVPAKGGSPPASAPDHRRSRPTPVPKPPGAAGYAGAPGAWRCGGGPSQQ